MKKYQSFLFENVQFLEVKFSIYLNRHVFVMYEILICEERKNERNLILLYSGGCSFCLIHGYACGKLLRKTLRKHAYSNI